MDAVVQIMAVTVRNTRTGKTVYDVACSDGKKRQIWDAELANQLNAYTGQVVTIRFDQKQNGQYLNESIQAFAPPGQQLGPDTMAAPMPAAPQSGAVAQLAAPPIQPSPTGNAGGSRWTPETTTRITKLACIEYATTLVGGLLAGSGPEALDEALAMADKAAKHFYIAARSHEAQPQQTAYDTAGQIVPTATTPAEVAAQLPPGTVQVGAPAVAAAQDASAEAPDTVQWD